MGKAMGIMMDQTPQEEPVAKEINAPNRNTRAGNITLAICMAFLGGGIGAGVMGIATKLFTPLLALLGGVDDLGDPGGEGLRRAGVAQHGNQPAGQGNQYQNKNVRLLLRKQRLSPL